jgi:hypothetical protein
MTIKEIKDIIEACSVGGVVSLDAIAVIFMFCQAKFFLNKKPDMNDYTIFRDEDRKKKQMLQDKERWQGRGEKLYSWIPCIILASLFFATISIYVQ